MVVALSIKRFKISAHHFGCSFSPKGSIQHVHARKFWRALYRLFAYCTNGSSSSCSFSSGQDVVSTLARTSLARVVTLFGLFSRGSSALCGHAAFMFSFHALEVVHQYTNN